MDWTVLLFAFIAACLAGGLSSLAPLWHAVRTSPGEVLGEGSRASAGARTRRLSQGLVVAVIALAFALLAVSAAMIERVRNLAHTSPGFDTDHLLTFQITLSDSLASDQARRIGFQQRLLAALQSIPGVSDAALSNQLPLAGCCFGTAIYPEGRLANLDTSGRMSLMVISSGYFRTMRIPLRSGRLLNDHDGGDDLLRVVINQAAAAHYWPDRDPVGAYGHMGNPGGSRFQVIGVVSDVRNDGLSNPTVPEFYLLSLILPANPMEFVVRSPLPAKALVPQVRRAVQSVDAAQPIHDMAMMRDLARESMWLERTSSWITAFFAAAALLLATLGIYGQVSYSVRQRTVEIGTRMALGATPRDLLSLVIGGALRMASLGVVLGVAAALAAAGYLVRAVRMGNIGWLPFALATVIVAAVAVMASLLPAWRAALLSPMVAIREQPESMWASARRGIRRAAKGISEAIAGGEGPSTVSAENLLTEFVDTVRRAASFGEALEIALAALCHRFGANSGLLLEKISDQECRSIAAIGGNSSHCSLGADGFLLRRLSFQQLPLPLTAGDFQTWLRWAAEQRPEQLAEIHALEKTGARIAVPLRTRSEIAGVLLLGPPAGREAYIASEKRVLRHAAEVFALMIENAQLTERVVEQEKLRRDLALAAEVQKRLLPGGPPAADAAALAAVSLPARSVGGDYYDFLEAGDHRLAIALADIAGKGIAAALIMAVVQASLRAILAEGELSLPELAAKMNHFLHRSTGSSRYATFFYPQIDQRSRQLRYVNAGHNPPYLLRAVDGRPAASPKRQIEELRTGGTVIGLFPQASYEEAAVKLRPGDVLIAFTDGVPEALNPREEEFGEDRLKALVCEVADLPVQEISSRISERSGVGSRTPLSMTISLSW